MGVTRRAMLALGVAVAATAPATIAPAVTADATPVRYVVRLAPGAGPAVATPLAAVVRRSGGSVVARHDSVDVTVVSVPAYAVPRLAAVPGVTGVTRDARLQPRSTSYDALREVDSLYSIGHLVNARGAWTKTTGAGIDIAIVDSGVSPVAGLSDAGKVVNGPDLSFESQRAELRYLDTYGHGTHLAGIIAGRDKGVSAKRSVNDPAPFLGIAPDARLVSVKVADARGMSDVSQVIAGIAWVVEHARSNGLNIRVLNLAYGTDSAQDYTIDPLVHAAEAAWRAGVVVVTSAGNSGAASGRLTSPAMSPLLLAVGADDTHGTSNTGDDTIPSFSSRGDGVRNPDVVAPGVHVQSLRVPGSYVDQAYSSTGRINDRFFRGSGTSQAAAVVSGAVALLLQAKPGLTPDDVRATLLHSSNPLPRADVQSQGRGLIDVGKALATRPGRLDAPLPSRGTGSLDAARGSAKLVNASGLALSGEMDIFSRAYDSKAMSSAISSGSSWAGGAWNGSTWAGSSWAGSSWASATWGTCAWSGSSLTSGTWTGSSWANGNWAGSSWAGSSWAGSSWAGSSWAGSTWATGAWT